MLKCLSLEGFTKLHVSILTSSTHPKHMSIQYTSTQRGAWLETSLGSRSQNHRISRMEETYLHSITQELSGRGTQQFSSLAEHLAVLAWHYTLFCSLQSIPYIFSNFFNKRKRQQSYCSSYVSSENNVSFSTEKKRICNYIFKMYCAMYGKQPGN